MPTRIIICARDGTQLAEFNGTARRSWILNDHGQAEITIPKNDPKITESLLRYNNRIVLISDNVPLWGGVIYTPRRWTDSAIIITAYSAEYLLKFRGSMDRAELNIPSDTTPAVILGLLVAAIQREETLGINIGNITNAQFHSGASLGNRQLAYDAIQDTISLVDTAGSAGRASNMEWDILPIFDINNRLQFSFNVYVNRGVFHDFYLEDGHNIEASDTLMQEQGDLYNRVRIWATAEHAGASWDQETVRNSAASRALYGLLEFEGSGSIASGGEPSFAAGNLAAGKLLSKVRFPRKTFALAAINVNNTFSRLDVGNRLRIRLAKYGFLPGGGIGTDTIGRIVSMAYSDLDGKMDLVVDEYVEDNS